MFTCRFVGDFVRGIMIESKQIIASLYYLFLFLREAGKSAGYPSSFTAIAYNIFDNIRVITVDKYGMCEDAKMELHVSVSGCLVQERVCLGFCPSRA